MCVGGVYPQLLASLHHTVRPDEGVRKEAALEEKGGAEGGGCEAKGKEG